MTSPVSAEGGSTNAVSAFSDDALGSDDCVGLLDRIDRGEVHPAELRAAAIARAQMANPALNAVVEWVQDPPGANGAFAGIPTFLKDNEDLSGLPTRFGSSATPSTPALHTSPFAKQLDGIGLSIVGKSSLPEFGLTATTESLEFGPTRNPRNLEHSTGGSSGGSAALVAAGVVPIAHANDGGGSIRIPASCCGLFGLKPSRGRLLAPADMERLPVSIVAQGVLTRTVRDTALFLNEIPKEASSMPPIGHVREPGTNRLRIGVVADPMPGMPLDPDVRQTILDTADECERLGHQIDVIPFPFDDQFGRDFLRYWAALAFSLDRGGRLLFGQDFDSEQLEPFTKGLADLCGSVALRLPTTIRRLRSFATVYEQTYRDFDVVLSPVLASPPPPIGFLSPGIDPHTHLVRLLQYANFTAIHNVAGAPAASLPLGVSRDGLPIGVQAAAHRGQEATLLGLAYELEAAVGWK